MAEFDVEEEVPNLVNFVKILSFNNNGVDLSDGNIKFSDSGKYLGMSVYVIDKIKNKTFNKFLIYNIDKKERKIVNCPCKLLLCLFDDGKRVAFRYINDSGILIFNIINNQINGFNSLTYSERRFCLSKQKNNILFLRNKGLGLNDEDFLKIDECPYSISLFNLEENKEICNQSTNTNFNQNYRISRNNI